MKEKITISRKQIVALLLLTVFLFIHIAKVFHTHGNGIPVQTGFETAQVEKDTHCDVCDFHFSKDAESASASADLSQPPVFPISYKHFTNRVTSSIGLSFSDRGPPAIA